MHVTIRGIKVESKYCHLCGIQRPPRASHCRETDRCVEKWDHYCPWVGTSVGGRNYRWFVGFVLTAFSFGGYSATCALLHLQLLAVEAAATKPPFGARSWFSAVTSAPISALLLLYSTIVVLMLSMLCAYHVYLVAINQTTYENIRGTYATRAHNPFDRGVLRNCAELFFPECFPPLPMPTATRWDEEMGSALTPPQAQVTSPRGDLVANAAAILRGGGGSSAFSNAGGGSDAAGTGLAPIAPPEDEPPPSPSAYDGEEESPWEEASEPGGIHLAEAADRLSPALEAATSCDGTEGATPSSSTTTTNARADRSL